MLGVGAVGPRFHPPVPSEVVVALLAEAVPFHQDLLLITPPTLDHTKIAHHDADDGSSLAHALRGHFRTVTATKLVERQPCKEGGSDATSRPPCYLASVESASPQSLDVVCFAPNVMSLLLRHCPYFLTASHRALRRHGIVSVIGQRQLRIAGTARQDFDDFVEFLQNELQGMATDDSLNLTAIDRDRCKWAVTARQSVESHHLDLYLSFPHVKRRQFTSEYRVTVDEIIGYVRAMPEYVLWHRLSANLRRNDDRPGVRRRRATTPDDPLELLRNVLLAHVTNPEASGVVAAEVDTFIITADHRRVNAARSITADRSPTTLFPDSVSLPRLK